ncbi:MAG: putative Fe-S cluster assembly protein SufT [Synoicihabitans sp.]
MSEHILNRAVNATIIPAGTPVELPAQTRVTIVQTLGGNVTVRTEQGLCRIAAEDSDAITGYEAREENSAPVAEFSEEAVWSALRTCFDPEIPLNIVDLGLVYDMAIEDHGESGKTVEVKMTLTAPGCGMGPVIAEDARKKVAALPTVADAKVHIVWDPTWTPHMISDEGRKVLGLE